LLNFIIFSIISIKSKEFILFITSFYLVIIHTQGIYNFQLARRRCEDMDELPSLDPKVGKSFELIGKRWTGLIIYVLMSGPKRFNEIHTIIPDLSKRMLTERMKELEENGIVIRHVIVERPIRAEYLLTKKGTELGKILGPISQWSESWMEE
jgi:DNA-binding HxlR family transcriptional regulator